jgi:hypothetical protein
MRYYCNCYYCVLRTAAAAAVSQFVTAGGMQETPGEMQDTAGGI